MPNDLSQSIRRIAQTTAWDWLPEMAQYAVDQAVALQQIPAPTFDEEARAQYIRDQFKALDLADTEIDALFNVYGRLPGSNPDLPAMMVSAHSDTVFPADTDLQLRHGEDSLSGPGLGDNCIGVSAMLALVKALSHLGHSVQRDVWLVSTSREEGMGNLGGMSAAYSKLASKINAVVNLEGLAFGHVYNGGIAVRRLRISAEADGGHSWLHFGRESAVHGILELGSRILRLEASQSPRSTFNIGMIEGGQGINVIATSASMYLDLRAEESDLLADLEEQVRGLVVACATKELRFKIDVVGDRPAGRIDSQHELVQAALMALNVVGVRGTLEIGSTDANIPLSQGCPAVTIGITRGGNAHRLDEYIDLKPITAGLQQLILLIMGLDKAK